VDTTSHLQEIRKMFAEGQYQRAADYVVELSRHEGYGGKRWTDPFIPCFDMKVSMSAEGAVKDYGRSVDFATGVATVRWADDRGAFERRLLASRADDVVALSITGPGQRKVNCELALAVRPARGQAVSSLRDAAMSYEVVDWLANNYWYPNLVTTHNPKSLFNTDLCGGLPAIIIKMLVDSQPGWIELLPALPREWPTGKIEGVHCRGQIEGRQLAWDGNRMTLTLRSNVAQRTRLKLTGGIRSIQVKEGPRSALDEAAPGDGRLVRLPAGRDVTFAIERLPQAVPLPAKRATTPH
jgi:hypothetical protein